MLRVAFSLLWLGVAWLAQLVVIANIVGLFLVLVYLLWFNAYFLSGFFVLRSSLPHTRFCCSNFLFLHLVSFVIMLSFLLSSMWPQASILGTITSTYFWLTVAVLSRTFAWTSHEVTRHIKVTTELWGFGCWFANIFKRDRICVGDLQTRSVFQTRTSCK